MEGPGAARCVNSSDDLDLLAKIPYDLASRILGRISKEPLSLKSMLATTCALATELVAKVLKKP